MIRPGTSRLSSCTLALLLALASCSKLPKETTSGAHTFGCRVDGKAWNTYTEHTLDNAIEAEYDAGFFTLSAERDTKKRGGRIFLQLADSAGLLHTRTYTGAAGGFYATYFRDEDGTTEIFQTGSSGTGRITLTRFTPPPTPADEAIVSGTFSFAATSAATGEVVEITDGRFDVKAR